MGYLYSRIERSRTTTCDGNIVARLTSRSITGHTLPIQVHQHYGFEFHLILRDGSCIRRICGSATLAGRVCSQLERGLVGLCSCVFDDRRELPFPGKVEPCLTALPLLNWFRSPCHCELCRPDGRMVRMVRWLRKITQWGLFTQREICSCRNSHSKCWNDCSQPFTDDAVGRRRRRMSRGPRRGVADVHSDNTRV